MSNSLVKCSDLKKLPTHTCSLIRRSEAGIKLSTFLGVVEGIHHRKVFFSDFLFSVIYFCNFIVSLLVWDGMRLLREIK
jgi:hypothetical protein